VLTRFAWPGYTSTLAEPRFYGVFSLLTAATSHTGARRISRTKASQGFQVISWCGCVHRPFGSLARPSRPRKRGSAPRLRKRGSAPGFALLLNGGVRE
jgi:hypothetical protein